MTIDAPVERHLTLLPGDLVMLTPWATLYTSARIFDQHQLVYKLDENTLALVVSDLVWVKSPDWSHLSRYVVLVMLCSSNRLYWVDDAKLVDESPV